MLERGGFFGGHLRHGPVKHGHEPIDLFGLIGMANILRILAVSDGPHGVDDDVAACIQESKERKTGGAAEALEQFFAARGIQILFFFGFLNVDSRLDEVLFKDRLGIRGLDETIEFPAPASP